MQQFRSGVTGRNNSNPLSAFQAKAFELKPIKEFEPPSADEVAQTVLTFVAGRIQSEKESGASDEKLNKLFEAARSGVEQGFSQAREQISKLGLTNEKLSGEIDQSYTKITTGIDKLEEKIFSKPIANDVPAEKALPRSTPDAVNNDVVKNNEAALTQGIQRSAGYDALSLNANNADINIKTRDGDIISISFENINALHEQYGFNSINDGQGNSLSSSSYEGQSLQSSVFNFSVKGSVDEGELKAIGDLLGQVGDLAKQFFGGDFQGAFQNALDLGYDGSEIAGFSLNFSQVQFQQVSAYESVAKLGKPDSTGNQSPAPETPKLDAVNSFTEKMAKLVDESRQAGVAGSVPSDLISKLLDRSGLEQPKVDEQQSFLQTLSDRLIQNLDQGKSTDSLTEGL